MKMRLAAGMLALLLAGCSNPESSMQLGNIAYRRGDKAAAVEYYKAAAQDSKTRAAANYNLGRVAFEEQQYEQALQYLDLALELKVEHPLVLVYRARTLLALGREEEALKDLEQAATRSSEQAEAFLELAKLLASQAQRETEPAKKKELLQTAVDKVQKARTNRTLTEEATLLSAAWRRELGQLPAAISELETLISDHSFRIETHFTLAQYLLENKEYAEAERYFRSGLRMESTNIQGFLGLAEALAGRGRYSEAAKMLDAVIATQGLEPQVLEKAKELRAVVGQKLSQAGDSDRSAGQ